MPFQPLPASASAKATLLVVDDQPVNIQVLYRALGHLYDVRMSISGDRALAMCIESPPDLVLLDIVMPGMDGHEVCRRLKLDPATCDIPVIFVTSQDDQAEEARGLEIGAVDFISKPINPAVVRARVQVQVELARSSRLLAATLEATEDGILVTDLGGRVTLRNRRLGEIWTLPLDMPPGTADERVAACMQASVSVGSGSAPVPKLPSDCAPFATFEVGGGRQVERQHRPLQACGRVIGNVFSFRDVTARHQAETALVSLNEDLEHRIAERTLALEVALRRADAASQAKSDLLSNVSHEIRTPMNCVLGMTHLALQVETAPKVRDYLRQVEHAGRQLLGLINDLLDYSKVEAGAMQLDLGMTELGALVDSVAAAQAHAMEAKGLVLRVEVDPLLDRPVRADALRLGQVLRNYLANAIKFTASGELRLSARALSSDETGALVRLSVQDSGIGIDTETLGQLFQPFRQADASTTRRYGGTGLGLAICKQLAGLMGGEVGAHSVPGEGSTFWLTLRLDWHVGTPVAIGDAAPVSLGGLHLLVAEDNLVNQQIAKEMLEAAGARVQVANHGREALELALANRFDCILMDVQMPLMDGFEATRRIRAEPRLAAVPVVAMTANAGREDEARCRAAGMDGFITKPIMPRALRATVASHCGRADASPGQGLPGFGAVETGQPRAEALLDLTVLADAVGANDELVAKYARMFQQTAAATLLEIDAALDASDWQALGGLGHRAKASARVVGAIAFARACEALEAAQQRGSVDDMRALVASLRPLLAHTSERIDRALPVARRLAASEQHERVSSDV